MYVRALDYRLHSAKITKQYNLMLLSDVHIEPILNRQDETNIAAILEIAKQRQPDAIMIAGDFLDTLEVLYCEVILEKIKSFLHILNSIAPVYIGVGNHDLGIGFQARQAKYELKMFSEYQSFIFSTHHISHLIA